MASNDTFVLRVALNGELSVYREIEIDPSKSLYNLAEAICRRSVSTSITPWASTAGSSPPR
jgi:hypothetical protein